MNRRIKEELEKEQLKEAVPEFEVGDTLRVSTRIIEGEKERTQIVQGTVIARKGSGLSETFSIHRVSYGEGMERVFYLHSPRISKIEVVKNGDVRRAKLYYLRGTSGKAAKIKERVGKKVKNKNTVTAEKTKRSESGISTTESSLEVVENGASAQG